LRAVTVVPFPTSATVSWTMLATSGEAGRAWHGGARIGRASPARFALAATPITASIAHRRARVGIAPRAAYAADFAAVPIRSDPSTCG